MIETETLQTLLICRNYHITVIPVFQLSKYFLTLLAQTRTHSLIQLKPTILTTIFNINAMIKLIRYFTLITLFSSTSFAQSELPKFAADVDKIKVKLDMPLEGRAYKNGTGYTLNPKMLPELPKKVALVSFYTFDPGFTKVWSTSSTSYDYYNSTKTTTTTTHIKKRNSEGNAGHIALGFYVNAIGALKSQFKEMGMELLEPEEFLNTDEKKAFYQNFEINRSKLNSFLSSALNSGNGHEAIYANPEGYRAISIDEEPFANYTKTGALSIPKYKKEVADGQLWVNSKIGKEVTSINDLTTALGVDAVIFVYSTIYTPKTTQIDLQNVNMLMFGPNPVPLKEGKDKKFNYFPGQMYIGTRVNVGVPIYKESKKDPASKQLNFDGYENITLAMTDRLKEYFDKAFSKR